MFGVRREKGQGEYVRVKRRGGNALEFFQRRIDLECLGEGARTFIADVAAFEASRTFCKVGEETSEHAPRMARSEGKGEHT